MDTIPTIAHIMNVPLHPNWKGRVVSEAILAVSSETATRNLEGLNSNSKRPRVKRAALLSG